MKLVIAPSFRSRFNQLKTALPHGLLLAGESGMGLESLARELANGKLEQVIKPLNIKDEVDFSAGSISVERIRQLYETTKGKSKLPRVVIVDGGERMTTAAQNAFLKLLEEPPEAMKFILTSRQTSRLLPTVRSRLETQQVPRISDTQSRKILDYYPDLQPKDRAQLMFVAAGRPALLHRLATNPKKRSDLVKRMKLARQFITTASRYERLILVAPLMADRQASLDFIDSCLGILWSQASKHTSRENLALTERLLHAHNKLSRNASPRLQLSRIVLQ